MSQLSIDTMSMNPKGAAQKERAKAQHTAQQFEQIFVRSMVSSLRQSGSVGGEGGMFGQGPGADTYADWFDDNLSEQLSKHGEIGIEKQLMADFERNHEVAKADGKNGPKNALLAQQLDKALSAADRAAMHAANSAVHGGIDVLH
jgi:Rod binding domain-containing protein